MLALHRLSQCFLLAVHLLLFFHRLSPVFWHFYVSQGSTCLSGGIPWRRPTGLCVVRVVSVYRCFCCRARFHILPRDPLTPLESSSSARDRPLKSTVSGLSLSLSLSLSLPTISLFAFAEICSFASYVKKLNRFLPNLVEMFHTGRERKR